MNRNTGVLPLVLTLLWFLLASPAGAKGGSYTLSVTTQGSGIITTNPVFATYPANVTVTLTATPNAGWYFGGWSGAGSGTVNPLNVTMTGNLSITGSFLAYPTYALTLTTNGQGSINLSPGGGGYYSNTVVTATAVPAAGWVFTGWSGDTNSVANPISLALDENLSLTANYAQLPAFTQQPVGHTNAAGSTVSLSALAVGAAPLAYQWFFGGASLSWATNATLTLTNATTSESGFYDLEVTNLFGSVTSSVVSLVLTNTGASTNFVSVCDEAALAAAIGHGGWISIGCSGTITLTNTLTITNNVILDGSSVSATISGGNLVRLFYVAAGASLAVTNLTLANGSYSVTSGSNSADGGAVYNNGGTLTLTACNLANNSASGVAMTAGGAIYNSGGTVRLFGSSLLNNIVLGIPAGRPYFPGVPLGNGYGGAIFNTNGTLVMVNCLVESNSCTSSPGGATAVGGAICQVSGALFITNSLLTANSVVGAAANDYLGGSSSSPNSAAGGALAALGGSVAMDLSQLTGNLAAGGNGGLSAYAGSAFGGAVFCSNAWSAVRCSFSGNQALAGNNSFDSGGGSTAPPACGGAIYNLGAAVLDDCLVSSNVTMGASSLLDAYSGSSNGGNAAGGGIYNAAKLATTNCTIAFNTAVSGQGVVYSYSRYVADNGNAYGGGIFNSTNGIFFGVNVTLASNLCNALTTNLPVIASGYGNGFAAGSQIANTNGTVQLRNSLLAYGGTNGNAYGVIIDLGDNISSDGSANFASGSSYNFTDPLLGPLANNGGPTLTMALLPDSPAIQFANSATAPPDDQRGYARPTGPEAIDLGAYQSGATQIYTPTPTLILSIADAYPNVIVSFTTSPLITNTLHFQVSTNLTLWTDLATFGALASPTNISQTISQQGAPRRYFRLEW